MGRVALEWLSCGIHGALYGDRRMSLCARAWQHREHWFWAGWVIVWDALLGWYEADHCRASFDRCSCSPSGERESNPSTNR